MPPLQCAAAGSGGVLPQRHALPAARLRKGDGRPAPGGPKRSPAARMSGVAHMSGGRGHAARMSVARMSGGRGHAARMSVARMSGPHLCGPHVRGPHVRGPHVRGPLACGPHVRRSRDDMFLQRGAGAARRARRGRGGAADGAGGAGQGGRALPGGAGLCAVPRRCVRTRGHVIRRLGKVRVGARHGDTRPRHCGRRCGACGGVRWNERARGEG